MAINIKTVTCPACGAKVNYDENNKTAVCEFCGALLDMTEVYGEKKDRERDDIQDMQIKNIMNKMNGKPNADANTQKAKKTALIIAIVFILLFSSSILFSIMSSSMRFADSISKNMNGTVSKEVTNDVNPFDKLTISFYGISGAANARISDSNVRAISSIEKNTTGLEKLSNGDTITVKYIVDQVKEGYNIYNLVQTEKTFTVAGLDEYVTDIAVVGEEDLAILKKNAISLAESKCKEEKFSYVPDSFGIYAIYTMVENDYSKQKTVFIVSFDYKDTEDENKVKTGYFMADYSNVTKLAKGGYKINFNADTYTYTRESYFNGFTVMSAHSTWDAVYNDVYLNNKAEWIIHEEILE